MFLCGGRFENGFEGGPVLQEKSRSFSLKTHYKDRLRIGGPEQAPTVREVDTDPIDIIDNVSGTEVGRDFGNDIKLGFIGPVDADLRSVDHPGEAFELVREWLAGSSHNFDEAAGGVERIVEAEIAICKEDVTRHLSS